MSRFLSDAEYSALLSENRKLKSKIDSINKGIFIDKQVSKLKRDISRLERKVTSRDKKIEDLDGKLYRANEKISKLEKENQTLKEENEKLKLQNSKDYTNSSLPSSANIFTVKVKNSRVKSNRKPGGQLGHIGHPRRQYEADEYVYIDDDANITNNSNYVYTNRYLSRKLIDLSFDIKIKEFRSKIYKNKNTGDLYHSSFPEGLDNEINYSSNIKAIAYYLNNYCNVSIDKTKDFIYQLTNRSIDLSKGFISNLNKQFHLRSKEEIEELFSSLSKADILYTDNTNARVNGESRFVYVTTDKAKALYNAVKHKGHEGVALTPVSVSTGVLVHDHDKTFYNYGKSHQECLAHHLRYLQASIDYEKDITWSSKMKQFLQETIHDIKKHPLDKTQIKKKKNQYDEIVHIGLKEYVIHPPNKYYMDGYNLLMRMRKYKDATLYFLEHPQVDYTNNISERLCRKVKRKIKAITTFRSEDSLSQYCDGLSIIETARNQNLNIFEKICSIFDTPKHKEETIGH